VLACLSRLPCSQCPIESDSYIPVQCVSERPQYIRTNSCFGKNLRMYKINRTLCGCHSATASKDYYYWLILLLLLPLLVPVEVLLLRIEIVSGGNHRHDGSEQWPSSHGVYVVSVLIALQEVDTHDVIGVGVVDRRRHCAGGRRRRRQVANVSTTRQGHDDVRRSPGNEAARHGTAHWVWDATQEARLGARGRTYEVGLPCILMMMTIIIVIIRKFITPT